MTFLARCLSVFDRRQTCVLEFFTGFTTLGRILQAFIAIKKLLAGRPHKLSVTVDAAYRLIGEFRYFAY